MKAGALIYGEISPPALLETRSTPNDYWILLLPLIAGKHSGQDGRPKEKHRADQRVGKHEIVFFSRLFRAFQLSSFCDDLF
jgi:hypothetical protein